jgi:hypothetical protein
MIDCCVKVTSEEEFKRVEDICFKNGIKWYGGSKEHKNRFDPPHTFLYVHKDDKDLTYSHEKYESDYISFNEFIEKYGKNCIVRVNTADDYIKVQEICFENGLCWGDNTQDIVKELTYHPTYLYVGDKLSHSSHLVNSSETFILAEEFFKKNGPKKYTFCNDDYRIKTEKEFENEFGDNWKNDIRKHWNSFGSMDFLFGRKLTKNESEKLLNDETVRIGGFYISIDMMIKRKTKKQKYRFKTEKEFIGEFGKYWRGEVDVYFVDGLDEFFGKELDDYKAERLLDNEPETFGGYYISKEMITPVGGMISSIKKRIKTVLHQETKVTLSDSLYKRKKPNLNQDNTKVIN